MTRSIARLGGLVGFAWVLASPGVPAQTTSPAAGNEPAFRYERQVIPGGPGPNRLAVDVELLAGATPMSVASVVDGTGGRTRATASGGLDDLRLFDASGGEVPFLVIAPPPVERDWIGGTLLPVAATKVSSGVEVDLGRAAGVDRLRLAGLPPPFLKRARLEGSGDRARWTLLVGEGTLFDLPDDGLERLELEFPPGVYRYLRLTWDDRSSGRLPAPRAAAARVAVAAAPAPMVRVPAAFERRPSEPGRSRYRISLRAARLPVAFVELDVAAGNVSRVAAVYEARLAEAEAVPVQLGAATMRRTERGALAATALRIAVNQPVEAELELVVEDGSNPPLAVDGISVVFAELPWIFFQSPDGSPVTARFGLPGLAAPRYDLEAMRDAVPGLRVADARWGAVRTIAPAGPAAPVGAADLSGAALSTTGFRYSRRVPAGPAGLVALRLDAAAWAHSRVTDLRIVDGGGRQVPYLVERLGGPTEVALDPLVAVQPDPAAARQGSSQRESVYRLRMPYEGLLAARLVLSTPARVFSRRVRVLVERHDAGGRGQPRTDTVASATWTHAHPETPAPSLAVDLPAIGATDLRLVVEEGDNSPLALDRPRLQLPGLRLRFVRPERAELTLFYGHPELTAPRYDLALLAPRVLGAAAVEIAAGPERQVPAPAPSRLPTRIFWGVLIAAVVVLLALVMRLISARSTAST